MPTLSSAGVTNDNKVDNMKLFFSVIFYVFSGQVGI